MDLRQRLRHLQQKMPRNTMLLGIIALVLARYIYEGEARTLYSIIALGPILGGITQLLDSRFTHGERKKVVKLLAARGWIAALFGLILFTLSLARVYPLATNLFIGLLVVGATLVGLGIYVLVSLKKLGFPLRPW